MIYNLFGQIFLLTLLATISIIRFSDEMKISFNNSRFHYPWHLSLQFKNANNTKYWHICSAAILTKHAAIVPAYCVDTLLAFPIIFIKKIHYFTLIDIQSTMFNLN